MCANITTFQTNNFYNDLNEWAIYLEHDFSSGKKILVIDTSQFDKDGFQKKDLRQWYWYIHQRYIRS